MERIYKYIRNKMTSNIENLLTTYTKGYHERFTFNLSECTSINGFTFAQGWHFLVETLEQYKKNPSLNYDYSALAMYYERFQPQNLNEVLYGKSIDKYIPELSKYKDPQNAPMPWTPITKLPQKYMTNRSDYGPKSKDSFYGIRRACLTETKPA